MVVLKECKLLRDVVMAGMEIRCSMQTRRLRIACNSVIMTLHIFYIESLLTLQSWKGEVS